MAFVGTSEGRSRGRGQLALNLAGRVRGFSSGRGQLAITTTFTATSPGVGLVTGVPRVVHVEVLSVDPVIDIPSATITLTGTLLTTINSIEIHFPDNTVISIAAAAFLTQTDDQITFILPAHPTDAFYSGPAIIRPISFSQSVGDFAFTYAVRPVMVNFVGGPLDGSKTVNGGVSITGPVQFYASYGLGAQQPDGYGTWADYQYASTLVADPIYAAHYQFDWIPGTTATHPRPVGVPVPPVDPSVTTPHAVVALSGLDPAVAAVGQNVTVKGSGLLSVTQLNIDGLVIPTSAFTQVSNIGITFQLPLMSTGDYSVTATNPSGVSNTVLLSVGYVVAGSSISQGALSVS